MVNLADDLTPETLPARLEMAEVQAALEAAQLGNWRGWQAKMDLVKFGLLSFLPDLADDAKRPGTGKTAPGVAPAAAPPFDASAADAAAAEAYQDLLNLIA
jgi:hypothetical protein